MTACSLADRQAQLRYGKETVTLDLSEAEKVTYLYGNEMPTLSDLPAAFRAAVEDA